MPRLIAADALAAELYKHHVHDDEELEPLVYLADAERVIANAPTVDAIPVEWLKNRREGLIFAAMTNLYVYGDNTIELCHAVNMVLDMWREEQEAQDGRV